MKVTLKRPVTDKGCVWEYELWLKNFNDLPEGEKYGIVTDEEIGQIFWPAVNHTTSCVFPDEVVVQHEP